MYKRQGQNIVLKGDRVTESQLSVLTALGLLEGDRLDMELYLGTSVVLLVLLVMFICLCAICCRDEMRVRQNQIILLLVGTVHLLGCVLIGQINMNLMPIALGGLMLTVAVGMRVAVVYNLSLIHI